MCERMQPKEDWGPAKPLSASTKDIFNSEFQLTPSYFETRHFSFPEYAARDSERPIYNPPRPVFSDPNIYQGTPQGSMTVLNKDLSVSTQSMPKEVLQSQVPPLLGSQHDLDTHV